MRSGIRVQQVQQIFGFAYRKTKSAERECGAREICFCFLRKKKIQHDYMLRKIIQEEREIQERDREGYNGSKTPDYDKAGRMQS